MAHNTRGPRAVCACGHRHHDPADLATIAGSWICRCPRCWAGVVIAARIGQQLRLFAEARP